MLARGLRRRCPLCSGRGAFFTSWFRRAESCRTCGLRWQRSHHGFEAAAGSTAVLLSFGSLLALLVPYLVLTWPDLSVLSLVAPFFVLGIVVSLAISPISFTVWQAIDLRRRPAEPDHFALDHLAAGFGVVDSIDASSARD